MVVAAEFGVDFLPLVHRFIKLLLPQLSDLFQAPAESLTHRLHMDCASPLSAAGADMREAGSERAQVLLLVFLLSPSYIVGTILPGH